jgi:hypothetical protein
VKIDFRPNLRARRGKLLTGDGADGQPVHAGAFLKQRHITLDSALLDDAPELMRILTHELFHFVWRRLDNTTRREWEQLLAGENTTHDLGWSAEHRRQRLTPADSRRRTKAWREYCCEAFADTAAWLYSPPGWPHEEFSLPAAARRQRKQWFLRLMKKRKLPL